MNEEEQFKLYQRLMLKALEEPNEINFICMQVIVSLAKLGQKDKEEFKEILNQMEEEFEQLDSLEELMMTAMAIQRVMDL